MSGDETEVQGGGAESAGADSAQTRQAGPEPVVEVEAGEASVDPVAAAEARRDEAVADLQRVAAEFANYRKRVLRDQQALVARAHERLVLKLLPVLDDLERALEAAEHHEEAKVLEGVRMTCDALRAALGSEGLTRIEADGAFDPHVHEALLAQPAEDVEPGTILQVVQSGYRLGDVVVRPARVVVAE